MTGRWPDPAWTPAEPFPKIEVGRAFTGERQRQFLALRYFKKPNGALVALASFGPQSEGAPGRAHGGAILTALDEALGAAVWNSGHRVLTARLTTEFRLGVPLGAELLVETAITAKRRRLVDVEGRLLGPDGRLYASAEGRFIEIDGKTEAELFGAKR